MLSVNVNLFKFSKLTVQGNQFFVKHVYIEFKLLRNFIEFSFFIPLGKPQKKFFLKAGIQRGLGNEPAIHEKRTFLNFKKVPTAIKLKGGGEALMVRTLKKNLFLQLPLMYHDNTKNILFKSQSLPQPLQRTCSKRSKQHSQ